eukprot:gene763-1070_t
MALNQGSDMTAEDWDVEAAEMVEEVIKTQQEVADLIKQHSQATGELEELKKACTDELEELQSDAWKLQLYAELERMASQLHHLTPIAQDSSSSAESSSESSGVCCGNDGKLKPSVGPTTHVQPIASCHQDQELQNLDDELAAVNRQLEEAKQEMEQMIELKAALQTELMGA